VYAHAALEHVATGYAAWEYAVSEHAAWRYVARVYIVRAHAARGHVEHQDAELAYVVSGQYYAAQLVLVIVVHTHCTAAVLVSEQQEPCFTKNNSV
jgi:hypothetical protein